MKKRISLLLFLLAIFALSSFQPANGWIEDEIWVQKVDRQINLDGNLGDGEWSTGEDKFREKLSGVTYDQGTETEIEMEVTMLRDNTFFYVLLKITSVIANFDGDISLGIGIADKGDPIGTAGDMDNFPDRRFAFHNGTTNQISAYDLYDCKLVGNCYTLDQILGDTTNVTRDLALPQERPGFEDPTIDIQAAYGIENSKPFFEMKFNLTATDSAEDFDIQDGTNVRFIMNPYANVHDLSTGGHGGKATNNLELSWSERPFIPRPDGPMDGLAILFNVVFGGLVVIISSAILISNRSEKWAKRFWSVDITEEQVNKSLIMEIGYYNSSFLAIFGLFLFWLYTVIAVIYGVWANWGIPGAIINGIPFLVSSAAMADLIMRNHNPQEISKEERKDLGDDVEKTGGLWIVPPMFLLMTLFMLVFIGIDVIS